MSKDAAKETPIKSHRGIPQAIFIENVEKHLGGPDIDVEPTLKLFSDALAKYRFMEQNLAQRKQGLEGKIPDIKKTLMMVQFLHDRRTGKTKASDANEEDEDEDEDEDGSDVASGPLKTTFELNDTLFAEAELEDSDTVYIWLGANVMLSYTLPNAIALLESKLKTAEASLVNTTDDAEFLREQITIMEVNTARVYNWDVKRRRERRKKEEANSGK